MAIAAKRLLGDRIRRGLIVGVLPSGTSADGLPFPMIVGGHPTPTAESERGGREALQLAASLQAGETLLVLLSGGASALMAVPADGLTLADKRATTAAAAARGRRHSRAQHRPQTSVGHQRRLARREGRRRVPDVRHLRRRRRRPQRHRVGADGARREHVPRHARHPAALRRRTRVSGDRHRSDHARRRGADRRNTEGRRCAPCERADVHHRRPARRDGRRGARPKRAATTWSASTTPSSAKRAWPGHRIFARAWPKRPASGVPPASCRAARRRSTSPATARAAAIRNSRWRAPGRWRRSGLRRRWRASAPTASTARRMPRAPSSTTPRSTGRGGQPPARGVSHSQRRVSFLRVAGRSHPHGSDRHQRRRPSNHSVSLSSDVFS